MLWQIRVKKLNVTIHRINTIKFEIRRLKQQTLLLGISYYAYFII